MGRLCALDRGGRCAPGTVCPRGGPPLPCKDHRPAGGELPGPEVPLRWLCNSVGMDPKDLAWYFENGYFVNLSLDLNQKMVRRRTVPRHDLNRG